jgi:uncharacterized protein YdaU (DUF1376 family)
MPLWVYDLEADRDCRKMSDATFGRYMRLLIRQWIEGSVPATPTDAMRDALLDSDSEGDVQSLLDRKFSEQVDGGRANRRLDAERSAAMEKVATNRANGAKGGRPPKTERFSETKPNGSIRAYGSGSESDSSEGGSAEGGGTFDAFWTEYPKKVGKRPCAALWSRRHLAGQSAEVMAGLARCKASAAWSKDGGQFIPNPQTWLNRDGWLDELDAKPARKVDPLAGLSRADDDALFAKACEQWPDCKVQGRGSDYTRARMAKLARGAA